MSLDSELPEQEDRGLDRMTPGGGSRFLLLLWLSLGLASQSVSAPHPRTTSVETLP